jgi:hypothetical protein
MLANLYLDVITGCEGSVISGFHSDVDKICALLRYDAASSDDILPTFRDNVSVPSSRVKNSKEKKQMGRRD